MNEQPLIVVNGEAYANYNYIEIVNEFAALPSYFICEYTSLPQTAPKSLDKYSLRINNQNIQTGTILQSIRERTGGNNSQNLYTIMGKDNTWPLGQHSCGQVPIQENIDLLALARKLATGLNVNFISSQSSLIIKRIKVRPDETVYNVLKREANRFGLLLYSDGSNCIIDQEGAGKTIEASIIDSYYQGNTITTKFIRNYSSSYDTFISTIFDYTTPTTLKQKRSDTLFGLQKYFYTRDYLSSSELTTNLQWLLNQNIALENTYQVIVPAHVINGEIPQVGDYMYVEDDHCGIKGPMLIYKTRFMWEGGLSTLELTFKVPGTFTNSAAQSAKARQLTLGD